MAITKKDLMDYQNMAVLVNELSDEIQSAYNTYHSPSFTPRTGSASNTSTSGPQDRAMRRIERLQGKLNEVENRMNEINDFVNAIDDPFINAVLRDHYIRGFTWQATSVHLKKSESYIRQITSRYFREHGIE